MNCKYTTLVNGKIITEDSILENSVLRIKAGYIDRIADCNENIEYGSVVDCAGNFIMPGLIDIHSDVIENIIVPRKGIVFSNYTALSEIDKELASQGITTMYHSISIANSTICNRKRTLSVNQMIAIGDDILKYYSSLLIRHRFHARLELNTIEAYSSILKRLKNGVINELSLMNHTPGQGQYSNLDVFKDEIRKQYGDISPERINEIICECQNKPLLSQYQIKELLETAHRKRIPIAVHDVERETQLKFMKENGIKICEFPLNFDIAEKAHKQGLYNLVGAPNIMKNGSHNKNVSALDLIKAGYAHILCSDYYTPALLQSIFMIAKKTNIPLYEAVKYATLNPAIALGIQNEYGSIVTGKKADIIIVSDGRTLPKVCKVLVNGKVKIELNYE